MSKNKAFVRYANNKVVPSSLFIGVKAPKVGVWKEIPYDLCCNNTNSCTPNYSPWRIVTGGVAGDGVVLIDEYDEEDCPEFTFIGPNDSEDDGWVYLTQYFSTETCLEIQYEWSSYDNTGSFPPVNDRPVYWIQSTQPTGIPGDITPKVDSTPDDGTWEITIPAGQWFSIGIYSSDSCCGRGFLSVEICETQCPEVTTTTTTETTRR